MRRYTAIAADSKHLAGFRIGVMLAHPNVSVCRRPVASADPLDREPCAIPGWYGAKIVGFCKGAKGRYYPVHAADEFSDISKLAIESLSPVVDMDWSVAAGTLDWTCWQTVDHVVDCVFSYAMQFAARAPGDFLPFHQLHALPEATPADLVMGLRAVVDMFAAVLRSAPPDAVASDGLAELGITDWAQRGAHEVLLHTHDVLKGLEVTFDPPGAMSEWVLRSEALWMLDLERAKGGSDPWTALLLASGRSVHPTG